MRTKDFIEYLFILSVIIVVTTIIYSSKGKLREGLENQKMELASLGTLKITAYRSVKSQTDSSPYWTSIGIRTNPFIIAVSPDLLKNGTLQYGDLVYIEGFGFKHVGDVMNKRHTKAIDIWVETYAQEKIIGVNRLEVWLVKRP